MDGSFWATILLLAVTVIGADSLCKSSSFVVERHSTAPGGIVLSKPVNSLKECLTKCGQTLNCTGFNFLIDAKSQPHCVLVDSSKEESEKLLPSSVLYSGTRLCLLEVGLEKSFSFEKWPQRTLKTNQSVIAREHTEGLEDCLRECQKRDSCRSATFNRITSECILSSVGINTVYNTRAHFDFDDNVDLFENNARGTDLSRFDSQCSYMRLKSAGLPEVFDSQEKAEDVEECERICVGRDRYGDPCRSYTYDSTKRRCLMSAISARLTGKSPLSNHDGRYTHGDLDDCTDFSLHCQENGLELRGSSIRQFSGFIRTKEGKQLICNKQVTSTFDFRVKLGFNECGLRKTEKPFPAFSGVIHIKEGSTPLVTIRDKVLQVECRMHGQMDEGDRTLAVEMKVEDGNRTDRILSDKVIMVPSRAPPQPKYSLKVLGPNGVPSDTMRVGDHGWVQISMNKKEIGRSFSISKLEARDLKSGANVTLLDEEGCVVNRGAVEGIQRGSPHDIRFRINYGVFNHEAEIVYYAHAEPCTADCDPKCNSDLFEEKKESLSSPVISMTRTRRAISPRQMELAQDLYTVHGSRVIVLPKINKEILFREYSKAKDVTAAKVSQPSWHSSFLQCVLEDTTCLFSFALASLQFCLVVLCLAVMYCYIQQYRRYRTLHEENSESEVPAQTTISSEKPDDH